ncbi:MAG: hypothetical protein AB8B83_04245 [Bdellovibrionales bacterium]
MSTRLPTDANDFVIPALRLMPNGAHTIQSGISAQRNSTAFSNDTRVISIYATEDVYLHFGDASVSASTNDHFFPKGVYYDVAIAADASAAYSHVSALQVSNAGSVYISEKF